jgi:hypothetical protein
MSRTVLALVALTLLGCSSTEPLPPVTEDAEHSDSLLLSTVHVADPRTTEQLLDGFHNLEGGSWRWTKQEFSVLLEPPPPVPLHSPELELVFTVPEVTIDKLGSITVRATLNGVELGETTVSEAAQNIVLSTAVPKELLAQPPLHATYHLDHAMPPTPQDARELGIIAISIALK